MLIYRSDCCIKKTLHPISLINISNTNFVNLIRQRTLLITDELLTKKITRVAPFKIISIPAKDKMVIFVRGRSIKLSFEVPILKAIIQMLNNNEILPVKTYIEMMSEQDIASEMSMEILKRLYEYRGVDLQD